MSFHLVSIKVQDDGGSDPVITVPVTRNELFKLLWVLDHSTYVTEFKVDETATHKTFCWGEFAKWVTEFTWDIQD